jgi:hypothetical protein
MLVALFATRVVRRYQIRTLLHEAERKEKWTRSKGLAQLEKRTMLEAFFAAVV